MNFLRRLSFNFWYLRRPPWDSGITPPELFEFIQSHPAGRALDIGCGTGTNVITLAKTGWQTQGFDFASRAISIAKRKAKKAGVQANLFTDDATQMKNVKGQFDLALDIGCFHGIQNKTDYLTQLDRILAPNGFWLMYGFFRQTDDHTAPGLVPTDLDLIPAQTFTQLSRRDSLDKRGRKSVWMLYQKTGKVIGNR